MITRKDNILVISIKPQYAEKIFSGIKTIELRKSIPQQVSNNSSVLIYVTSPVFEIWGTCKIEEIVKDDINIFWEKFGNKTGVNLTEFNEYYENKNKAFGIKLKDIKKSTKKNLSLSELREIIPGFSPPQTYKYLKTDLKNHIAFKELF
jgi:predicted transcriptional regulator